MTGKGKLTIGQLIRWAAAYLETKLETNPRLEAEVLLAHVLGWSRTKLLAEATQGLTREQAIHFVNLLERRGKGYPLQYLTGGQQFMSLDFLVQEGVLIPRADTEILAEKAIQLLLAKLAAQKGEAASLLVADVCTGSGAVGLSIAHYVPEATVLLSDVDPTAVAVAQKNCRRLGLSQRVAVLAGDLLQPLVNWLQDKGTRKEALDMITANPPYISQAGWQLVEESVKSYEPRLALAGGADGLDYYRRLIPQAAPLLKRGGYLLVEIGFDQGQAVQELFRQAGAYHNLQLLQDYGGRDRVVVGEKAC